MSWEVKRDGIVVAWGEKSAPPSTEELRRLRSDGYRVFVDGKEVKK